MTLPVKTISFPAELAGKSNGQLSSDVLRYVPNVAGYAVRLTVTAARAFEAMVAAAAAAGWTLRTTGLFDSYRPLSVQEVVFRARYTTTLLPGRPSVWWNGANWWLKPDVAPVATPGTSNHGWGLAVDLSVTPALVDWLVTNAGLYGFSAELQAEDWHWRYYAGDTVPLAVIKYEQEKRSMPELMILNEVAGKVYARYQGGHTVHLGPTEYVYWRSRDVPQVILTSEEGGGQVGKRLEAARIDRAPDVP